LQKIKNLDMNQLSI